jgi:hypothetical protein
MEACSGHGGPVFLMMIKWQRDPGCGTLNL